MSTHRVHTTLEDNDARVMRHRCQECGQPNRILPPFGYRLALSPTSRLTEAEDAAEYFDRAYRRNDRLVHAKESRSAGGEDAADLFERLHCRE